MGVDTKKEILKSAERLFGEHGFDGVAIRQITEAAGVNTAAIHYHFGSKAELFLALTESYVEPLNQARLAQLKRCQDQVGDSSLGVESVIRALFEPLIKFLRKGDRIDLSRLKLLNRCFNDQPQLLNRVQERFFSEMAVTFSEALRNALPGADAEIASKALFYSINTMFGTLCLLDRLPRFAENSGNVEDFKVVVEEMISFVSAGCSIAFGRSSG